jgi:membrane associated rhomboid family serine protease
LALGIPHEVARGRDGPRHALVVRAEDVERALHTLREVDEEHHQRVRAALSVRPPERTPPWAMLWAEALAAALTAVGYLAGTRGGNGPWMQRGRLDSDDVFAGEVHRLVAAVTLHADGAHLLSNLLFLLVVAPTVIHRVGPGVTVLALIVCGAAGNAVTIGYHGPGFGNVGASGGVFGLACILGILAARVRVSRIGQNRWLLGTGAALGLLSMLAFGENADVVAHLAGFAAGAPLGLMVPLQPDHDASARRRAAWLLWQAAALAMGLAAVGWAWWAAWNG